jgi:hypothetical protein
VRLPAASALFLREPGAGSRLEAKQLGVKQQGAKLGAKLLPPRQQGAKQALATVQAKAPADELAKAQQERRARLIAHSHHASARAEPGSVWRWHALARWEQAVARAGAVE